METYEDRVLDEYSNLEERTTKLAEFLGSEKAAKVTVMELSYLQAQLPVMRQYLAILASRVACLPSKKEAQVAEKKEEPKVKEETKKDAPAKK